LDSRLRLRFGARAEAAGTHAIESARGDWRKHVLASNCWRWGHDAPVAAMSEDAMHDEPDEKGERKAPEHGDHYNGDNRVACAGRARDDISARKRDEGAT
jgi:hypothetical protein